MRKHLMTRSQIDDMWDDRLDALGAEIVEYTNGFIVNNLGKSKNISSRSIISGRRDRMLKYGTSDLIAFFDEYPDKFMTKGEFVDQLLEPGRRAHDEYLASVAAVEERSSVNVADVVADIRNVTPKMVARLRDALGRGESITDAINHAVGQAWGKRGYALLDALCAAMPHVPMTRGAGYADYAPF